MKEWRFIPGYEGIYSASSDGEIRSEERIVPHIKDGKKIKSRIMKPRVNRQTGYPAVNLMTEGRMKTFPVHVLVALAFIGERPAGMCVAHNDGNRMNPIASNLRYATFYENAQDMKIHGTIAVGSKLPQARLTESDIPKIRADNRRMVDIALSYGVGLTTISNVKNRKSWTHVE